METPHLIWHLVGDIMLILGLAGLVIPALQRFKISPILGYLLAGLLIGPYSIGLLEQSFPWISALAITDQNLVMLLAEFGVIFLLFMIGLELSFEKLWALKRLVVGLGGLQFIVTAVVIGFVAHWFGNSLETSILVGAAFSLSSTAMVMQLLQDRHMITKPTGRISFSILILQDLAVVPVLVLVGFFSTKAGDGNATILLLTSLGIAIAVILGIYLFGKLFLKRTLHSLSPSKNTEWLLALTLLIVIGTAGLTQSFGLSAALGAFLAGLLVGETEYKHEIELIIDPMKGLFMGVFFLSVGMGTNIAALIANPGWVIASVIGIFLLKAIILFPLALLFKIPKRQAAKSSIMIAQCGEFAFIIIGLALAGSLLPVEDAQFFLLVATVSLLIAPFTTQLTGLMDRLFKEKNIPEEEELSNAKEGGHIIIAGFGRVGQTLADILERKMIPYVAVDQNANHVRKLRAEGYPIIYGNARRLEMWKKLNGDHAKAAVITVDQHGASDAILQSLSTQWPLLPIIMRVKDTSRIQEYYDHGASVVVPETLESTLRLVQTLLEYSNIDVENSQEIIDQYRKEVLFFDK